jgi:sugar phosphate isomerase/epimerase
MTATVLRLGLDTVQLALSPMIREPDVWGEAAARLRDAGIEIVSGMMTTIGEDYSTLQSIARTGGVRPDEHWEANRAHAAAVADLAARERIGLVTFHAGFIPHDSSDHARGRMLDRLRELAEMFESRGVRMAFETGQESAATLLDALEALGKPQVGVNFDPANMILYGMGDPVEAVRLLSRRIVQVHVKDAVPTKVPGTWGTETPVGSGSVDWPRFLAAAMAIEPAVNFIIERESGVQEHTRESDIMAARDLVAAHRLP